MSPSLMSQFRHYIPRDILQKWSVANGEVRGTRLNTYNPTSDGLSIDTVSTSPSYRFIDLFKDREEDDPYSIEECFVTLERQAMVVIKKLEDAPTSATLTRQEVNTLRKFLFLLGYRNGGRSHKFVGVDTFDAMAREDVEAFRQAHSLKDYRAVWMANTRNILTSEHWEVTTNQDILYPDRVLYMLQMQHTQLGMFKAPDDCPFVLTENGFGLYEGCLVPALTLMGMEVSPDVPISDTAFPHTHTYVVSPKLVVILRGTHMTQEQFALDRGVPRSQARTEMFGRPISDSYFADFPRTPAQVTYRPPLSPYAIDQFTSLPKPQTLEDSLKPVTLGGQIINRRLGDTLAFQTHPISKSQAQRVNSLVLSGNIGVITFKSPAALLTSIEAVERDRPFPEDPRRGKISFGTIKQQLREVIHTAGVEGNPTTAHAPPPSASSSGSTQVRRGDGISTSLPGLRGAFSSRPKKTK